MTANGWVSIHRDILNSDLWLSEKFTRGQAWVDLILLANHKDGYFRKRGVRIDIKRGQVGYSELALSDRWRWSRGKVNRYLNELEIDGNIVQHKSRLTTLITIVKYDEYQSKQDNKRTTDRTTDGQQTDTNNNDNNDNNDNNKDITPKKLFKPPTIQQVSEYLLERQARHIDGQTFIDHHETRGWVMSNGRKMKDWKAGLRTWITNDKKFNRGSNGKSNQPESKSTRFVESLCNIENDC